MALSVFGFAYTAYSGVNLVLDYTKFITWVVSPDADEGKIAEFLQRKTKQRKVLLLATASCIKMVPKKLRSKAILAVFDTPEKLRDIKAKRDITIMDMEFKGGSVIQQKKVTPNTINALLDSQPIPYEEEGMPSISIRVFRGADAVANFRQGIAVVLEGLPKKAHKKTIQTFAKVLIGYTSPKVYKEKRTEILAQGAEKVDVMNLQKWIQRYSPLLSFQKICKGSSVEDALHETGESKHAKDLDFIMGILPPKEGLKFAVTKRKKPKKQETTHGTKKSKSYRGKSRRR